MRKLTGFAPQRLGTQIVLLMSLALLPLGLISIYQTRIVAQETHRLSQAALLSKTISAAFGERELLQRAVGVAQGLSATVVQTNAQECRLLLQDFVRAEEEYAYAEYSDVNGRRICSANDRSDPGTSGSAAFQATMDRRGASIIVGTVELGARGSVVQVSHPVYRNDTLHGVVTVSIPHAIVDAKMHVPEPEGGLKLASINLSGQVISASQGIAASASYMPRDLSPMEITRRVGQKFVAEAGDGTERFFVVTPLIQDSLLLVGSWPIETVGASDSAKRAQFAMLFPALMWITGILVAFFGLQRLVVRHVKSLRSAMRQFALGDRRTSALKLDKPPEEFDEAQRAFNRMSLILTDAEQRQESDLRDKEVLLREVHHRVKNNLQLIASIMNMQARAARSPESRKMLAGLQRRVRGLAMLHRTLYTTPDLTTVDAAELVTAVVEDVSNLSPEQNLTVETTLASVSLYPDQAVPLSMLLAEALTNAFKHSGVTAKEPNSVRVTLEQMENEDISLTIFNTISSTAPQPVEDAGDGLGQRLMRAFVTQLDGTETHERDETCYTYRVVFPLRDFGQ